MQTGAENITDREWHWMGFHELQGYKNAPTNRHGMFDITALLLKGGETEDN